MKISIKYIIPIIAIVSVATTFINTVASPMFVDSGEPEHPQCQYAFRPLINGQCDNSNPAGPPTPKPQPLPVYLPVEPPKDDANAVCGSN